jgi:hypothetical protein
MSFTADFTSTQGSSLNQLIITDTSTGSDTNLTDRQIFLYKIDGSTLVPVGVSTSYIDFPISLGSTITIPILNKDYSLTIVVNWISSSPIPGSTYTKTHLFTAEGNTNLFIYNLIQTMTAKPTIINDDQFYADLGKIQTEVDNAIEATTYNDQYAAQSALTRAQIFMGNQNLFF